MLALTLLDWSLIYIIQMDLNDKGIMPAIEELCVVNTSKLYIVLLSTQLIHHS